MFKKTTSVSHQLHDDDVINSVQIHIHTPGKENMTKQADAIILCHRLDDHFQNEDQQLIVQLGK